MLNFYPECATFSQNVTQVRIFRARGGNDMKKLTIRQARQALSHLDQLLAAEGEVMITRRGEAIARLVQINNKKRQIPSHHDLRDSMPRMRRGSEELIREDRNAR
jgi:antitoxin (DNA-binding transcriptional repressor) of toxin-antitoxin stability system